MEEIDLSKSNWTMDQIISSEIIYGGLSESYGKSAVDAVINKLEITQSDLCLADNTKIIIKILNGEIE